MRLSRPQAARVSASTHRRAILTVAATALAFACTNDVTTLRPPASLGDAPATREVLDGAHNAGNSHFFFLPPMVAHPTFFGTTDPGLSPSVSICDWQGGSCGGTVAVFSGTGGTNNSMVTYDPSGGLYQVDWNTGVCANGPCSLDPAKTYRVRVAVGQLELGHADIQVVANAGQAKNAETGDVIALVNGRTLPIKFRIEGGIVGAISIAPTGATIPRGATQQFTASFQDLHGQTIAGPSAVWSTSDANVAPVTSQGLTSGLSLGTATITASFGSLSATATLTVKLPFTPEILFWRSGSLWGMTSDGSNQEYIAPLNDMNDLPSWAPDGSAFIWNNFGTYRMNADGTGLVYLVGGSNAQWSPDGTRIAYEANNDIFVMNADGSAPINVSKDGGFDHRPVWSHDGTKIAFSSFRGPGGDSEIFVVNADGSGVEKNVSNLPGRPDFTPAWSPTADQLVFQSNSPVDIVRVNADGSGPMSLTGGNGINVSPIWSPDGTRVAFKRFPPEGIWVMNADGTNQILVSGTSPSDDGSGPVSWSPDGTRIAFTSGRNGNAEIYVASSDGTGVTRLTNSPAFDTSPVWRPHH